MIKDARTLTIDAVCHPPGEGNQNADFTCLLLIAPGNKASAKVHYGRVGDYFVVSDGDRMKMRFGVPVSESIHPAPPWLTDRYRSLITRLNDGLIPGVLTPIGGADPAGEMKEGPTNFRIGDGAGPEKTLTYTLPGDARALIEGNKGPTTVRLWYEPETFKLFRREVATGEEITEGCYYETYKTFTLDTGMPDELFKVTEKSK